MMLIVLFVIFAIVLILAMACDWFGTSVVFGILLFVVGMALIFNICTLVDGRVIDSKIELYEEENARIEDSIGIAVAQYMEYEATTFEALKGESVIRFVSLYPELKADSMVTKQIEVYIANNYIIRELKEQKISVITAKWWVYFGK